MIKSWVSKQMGEVDSELLIWKKNRKRNSNFINYFYLYAFKNICIFYK